MKKDTKLIISYSIIFIILLAGVLTRYIYPLDYAVHDFIDSTAAMFRLNAYLSILSFLFSPSHVVIMIALMLIGIYFYKRTAFSTYTIFAITSLVVGTALKYTVQRPRPSEFIDGFSFPSLHTLTLFVAIFIATCFYDKAIVKWIFGILIVSMMCSRIYLNAHFFSDTFASLIIVHLIYIIVVIVQNKIKEKRLLETNKSNRKIQNNQQQS